MNATPGYFDNLEAKIYRLCDACVHEFESDGERLELERLVQSSSKARELYLDFFLDSAALRLLSLASLNTDSLNQNSEPLIDLKLLRQLERQPDALDAAPSASGRQKSSKAPSRVISMLGGTAGRAIRSPIYTTLIVAGFIYGVFGYLAWDLRPDKAPATNTAAESVAFISDSDNVKWLQASRERSNKTEIAQGEPLKIESGTMELELKAGTKLVVEGPADWSVDGRNSVSLRAGKLMARVPQQAIGFTVETPTAKIVDLGTEFSVEVDEHQNSEVSVFTGTVVARNRQSSKTTHTEMRITAGNAVRIDGQQAKFATIPIKPKWRTDFAKGSAKRGLVALQNPTGTFSQRGYPVNDTIDGKLETVWAIGGSVGSDQQAVWQTATDIGGPGGTSFIFTLVHGGVYPQHGIGKFRLSVTTDDRDTFADGKQTEGKVAATWKELKPTATFSQGGETFTINDDNTILVSGTNPATTIYAVSATTTLTGITGIRLETLTDPSFAGGGPGRYPASGNFGLSEFRVEAKPLAAPKSASD